MTGLAWTFLVLTVVAAIADWRAVLVGKRRSRWVSKPLTMVCLIGAALAIQPDDPAARAWFVAALMLSLAGDVLLLSTTDGFFMGGLAAFLAAHVAYVLGLLVLGISSLGLVVGLAVVAVPLWLVGGRVLRSVRTHSSAHSRRMSGPVAGYVGVISAMVVTAVATGRVVAVVGAALFYASDAMIGWQRFVRPRPWREPAVMVTYHLGQIGLVLSLV